jgi:hypothetical protein
MPRLCDNPFGLPVMCRLCQTLPTRWTKECLSGFGQNRTTIATYKNTHRVLEKTKKLVDIECHLVYVSHLSFRKNRPKIFKLLNKFINTLFFGDLLLLARGTEPPVTWSEASQHLRVRNKTIGNVPCSALNKFLIWFGGLSLWLLCTVWGRC